MAKTGSLATRSKLDAKYPRSIALAPPFMVTVGRDVSQAHHSVQSRDLARKVGDDLDAEALDVLLVGPADLVGATAEHYLLDLVDVFGDGLSDAFQAGDAVPFGFLDPATSEMPDD